METSGGQDKCVWIDLGQLLGGAGEDPLPLPLPLPVALPRHQCPHTRPCSEHHSLQPQLPARDETGEALWGAWPARQPPAHTPVGTAPAPPPLTAHEPAGTPRPPAPVTTLLLCVPHATFSSVVPKHHSNPSPQGDLETPRPGK